MAKLNFEEYKVKGHTMVPGVFTAAEMEAVIADIERWGEEFLRDLPEAQRRWYLDSGASASADPSRAREVLRKLDNPHFHRPSVRALARDTRLVSLVESVIGRGVSVYFSQVFFKAPGGGGPKPAHQDNFYFGPRDPEALITAWIAFDDATIENGCLFFGDGTHLVPLLAHAAPPDEPFNLQVAAAATAAIAFTPAPVPRGGVSFHHGGVLHQSGPNNSARWRRACALHYVRSGNAFVRPGLPYDESMFLRIT